MLRFWWLNFQLRESSKLLELDYDFDSLTRKRPLSAGTDFIRGEMGISSYLKIAFWRISSYLKSQAFLEITRIALHSKCIALHAPFNIEQEKLRSDGFTPFCKNEAMLIPPKGPMKKCTWCLSTFQNVSMRNGKSLYSLLFAPIV